MNAKIVIGIQFGDEAKGLTTDNLCAESEDPIVVRFSGGQQAGHTVWINGVKHIHSSYGSGTLRGVPSYFSEHCTCYPTTMYNEYKVLLEKNVKPKLTLHPLCKVTTPFDVLYNRIKSSKQCHGTCGLGVGETMNRNTSTGYKLYAVDLLNRKILDEKLNNIHKFYLNKLSDKLDIKEYEKQSHIELAKFNNAMDNLEFDIQSYGYLKEFKTIIFEGSQGILLDMNHGIFPHVTYANTTSKNALEICSILGISNIEFFYVTRCYQTRHGAGWVSNDNEIKLVNDQDETNIFNQWQKDFRVRELDYDLLNYSLSVDKIYVCRHYENESGVWIRKNLLVSCLDQRPGFKFDVEKINYKFENILYSFSKESENIVIEGQKSFAI